MANTVSDQILNAELRLYNTWWITGKVKEGLLKEYKRNQYYSTSKSFNHEIRRVVVLSGLRRVGKTTIVYQIINDLLQSGVAPEKILYFSLDRSAVREAGIDEIIRYYRNNISDSEEFYLFIDEIQKDSGWAPKIKSLYDIYPSLRAVCTGSASSKIEKNLDESGEGRWILIKVPTLSFREYCELKGVKKDIEIGNPFELHKLSKPEQNRIFSKLSDLNLLFMNYMQIGGFPELIGTADLEYALNILGKDVIDKATQDIQEAHKIRNPEDLRRLFVYLCIHSSEIINIQSVSKDLEGISRDSIETYIKYLEEANLINVSRPADLGGKKPLKAQNKIYVSDYCIRNAVVLTSDIFADETELGHAIEATALKHIKDYYDAKSSLYKVGYAKNPANKEIDIVITYNGKSIQYVEAKMRNNSVIHDDDAIVNNGMKEIPGYVVTKDMDDFGLSDRKETQLYRVPAQAFFYLIG